MNTLVFRNTILKTISHNGQIWFTSAELAKALQYANAKSVTNLYNKNIDEFTTVMSRVIESSDHRELPQKDPHFFPARCASDRDVRQHADRQRVPQMGAGYSR